MKKMTFAIITLITAMAMPTMAMAAAPVAAPITPVATTAPANVAAPTTSTTTLPATDPTKVMVTINGVTMTQAQARLVILANIKNHTQMTPEEMVAYVNDLEAQATAEAEAPTTPTPLN